MSTYGAWLDNDHLVLHFGQTLARLTGSEFFEFCQRHPDLRLERTSEGDLIVLPPTGGQTGQRNVKLTQQVANWADTDATGIVFDSSTGFRLGNGADRSPDVAWVLASRWETLSPWQQEEFPPLAPDFVIELRSSNDRLAELRAKMTEYVDNGVRVGVLIDPYSKIVEIYRPGVEPESFNKPDEVTVGPEIPGLTLSLAKIWA